MTRTGWLVAGLRRRGHRRGVGTAVDRGRVVDGLTQPAVPPTYVRQAANGLNHSHPDTRVYALPGNNFAAYRWGDTIDTVYPALLSNSRPFVTHEQQTMGSLPTADLLEAVDTPLQDGVMDPDTLAPMASLMSAGDILVQYDQQYERYDTPNPQQLADDLAVTPPGLSQPVSYGTPRPNVSPVGHFDEQTLARPANQGWTSPLVTYPVDKDPRPIDRAESLQSPLVVAGNGSGLVNASSVGLLAGNPTIFYSGTLDTDRSLQKKVLSAHPTLVVTDTNRKQGYRWNGIADNEGYTETGERTSRPHRPDRLAPQSVPVGPDRRHVHHRAQRHQGGHRLVLRVTRALHPLGRPPGRARRQRRHGMADHRVPEGPVLAGRVRPAPDRHARSTWSSRWPPTHRRS